SECPPTPQQNRHFCTIVPWCASFKPRRSVGFWLSILQAIISSYPEVNQDHSSQLRYRKSRRVRTCPMGFNGLHSEFLRQLGLATFCGVKSGSGAANVARATTSKAA